MKENGTPLLENEYVKELFAILKENGKDTAGFTALLGYILEMENYIKRAENGIADMKSRLDTMKEVQDHPFRATLQSAIKTLEVKLKDIKERLGELKGEVFKGCERAVTAFKENGAAALSGVMAYFRIRRGLEGLKESIDGAIRADERAVVKIEAFSAEYHMAGRHLKNLARIAAGKEPINAKRESGKLAKALALPYRAQKSVLVKLKKTIDKAIASLNQFERDAKPRQSVAAENEKPSIHETMRKNKARAEREKSDKRITGREKPRDVAI